MASVPSGDTASTLPAAAVLAEMDVPLNTITPLCPKLEESTPRKASVPLRSKMIELGDEGNETGEPAENVEVVEFLVMGTSVASQAAFVGFAVAQAVVVA